MIPAGKEARKGKMSGWACSVGIFFAAALPYSGSLRVPFLFDDVSGIAGNASIRALWPPSVPLSPPTGSTLAGRPVANLSFAVNYAFGGTRVWGYHVLNIGIHAVAALLLFGAVRRTLDQYGPSARLRDASLAIAFFSALVWAVHPLQTEAVTYLVQRTESLMGLFYFLTVYCYIRAAASSRPVPWLALSIGGCLLGMGTKEVMASAPIIILLYDRTFVSGSFPTALRRRPRYYGALALTWIPLVLHFARHGLNRGDSAGFESPVRNVDYWLTQFQAITLYLRLSLWPDPLVFDYGTYLVHSLASVLLPMIVVVSFVAASVVGLVRRSPLGFLGAWFLLILAPTCLVPVATQTMSDHRMYLSLAAVAVLVAVGLYRFAGTYAGLVLSGLAIACGVGTVARNRVYESNIRIWRDTIAKFPVNPRAHCSLGYALLQTPDGVEAAIREFEEAIKLEPAYADAYDDLGIALNSMPSRKQDAIAQFREAVRLSPNFFLAHYNLGETLLATGRIEESIAEFREALRIDPMRAEAHDDLGIALSRLSQYQESIQQFEEALRIDPRRARAHFDLANSLVQVGDIQNALGHYREAVAIAPEFVEAGTNFGILLCRTGDMRGGLKQIEQAIQHDPSYVPAHFAHGIALLQLGRRPEAADEFHTVLRLRPGDAAAERMLQMAGPPLR